MLDSVSETGQPDRWGRRRERHAVGDEAAKVASYDAVPGGTLSLIELLLSSVMAVATEVRPPFFVPLEGRLDPYRSLDVLRNVLPCRVSRLSVSRPIYP